jgi:signal transduction histidine kinase
MTLGLIRPTIGARLVQLVAAVAAPLILLAAVGVWYAYASQRDRQQAALLSRAEAAAAMVDQAFDSALAALRVLAASQALAAGDLAGFDGEMRRASAVLGGALINLTASDGQVALTTFWPVGVRVAGVQATAFARNVLRDGRPAVSDLVVGPQSGLEEVGVAVPVVAGAGGSVWVLSLYLPVNALSAALSRMHLPAEWLASIVDREGRWVARTRDQGSFIGRHLPAEIAVAVASGPAGLIGSGHVSADGVPTLSAYARAPQTGYLAVIGIPENAFSGPLRATLLRTGAIAFLVAMLGVGAALLLARRIVDALGRVVAAPGRAAPTGMREIDDLALAIAAAEAALRDMNRDLAARVEAEIAARQAAQARAAQAERLQALGQLAGGIAHDFNNVLQAVMGGAALIARRRADPAAVERLAGMVGEAAGRGAAVTRRLLAFSRRGELHAELVDPAAVLDGLCDILAHTLGAGIEVRVVVADGVKMLRADKGGLETVLINLASNASDAMAGAGCITMAAAIERPAGLRPAEYVCFSVSDTGVGMDAATLARASEPFFTTKPVGAGTGLGLAMARGFAEQSGGGLQIESAEGVGTTVRLWLPVAESAGDQPAQQQQQPQVAGTAARLLLVDDDAAVLETMALEMEQAGYAVLPAASGPGALALLDAGEAVDLLVSDLSMPGMTGTDLIRAVQRRRPGLPAILLTGFVSEAAERAMQEMASDGVTLLRKPLAGAALAERVAVLLRVTPTRVDP